MKEVMNELALFAGAGGGLLGSKLLGWRTICYVEWNKYAVKVLTARIRDGYLDDAPIWDDANTFDGRPWAGLVDVLTAGFPCQPFSVAGKGLAENDPRNGWPSVIRIIREVRPRFALLENVPGLISKRYFGAILGELAEAGYDAEWDCISAAEVGAPHIRERIWILAHATGSGEGRLSIRPRRSLETAPDAVGEGQNMANSDGGRCQASDQAKRTISKSDKDSQISDTEHDPLLQNELGKNKKSVGIGSWWATEPGLGRVAHGVAHRVDRLRAIGEGQVPAVVVNAWNKMNGH